MKWNTKLFVAIVLLAIFLFAGGCQPAVPDQRDQGATGKEEPAKAEPAEGEPIKLGSLMPFSGTFAAYGPKFRDGVDLAIEEVGYQVLGRPIEIIYEDSAADPVAGLDKAKKLVEVDGVNVIIGPIFGHVVLAVEDYFRDNDVLGVLLFGSDIHPQADVPFITFPTTGRTYMHPWGLYTAEEGGYKTASTIFSDFSSGYEYQMGFKAGFESKGGKVIQEQWAPLGTIDFGPYLLNLDEQADVVVIWMPASSQMAAITQYNEFGLTERVGPLSVGALSLWLPIIEDLGDNVLGAFGPIDYTMHIDTPANKKFVETFTAKYNRGPDLLENIAYEATLLTLAAIEAAGGVDDTDKLFQTYINLEMNLPSGPIRFTPEGVSVKTHYLVEAKRVDGKMGWVPIHQYNYVEPVVELYTDKLR